MKITLSDYKPLDLRPFSSSRYIQPYTARLCVNGEPVGLIIVKAPRLGPMYFLPEGKTTREHRKANLLYSQAGDYIAQTGPMIRQPDAGMRPTTLLDFCNFQAHCWERAHIFMALMQTRILLHRDGNIVQITPLPSIHPSRAYISIVAARYPDHEVLNLMLREDALNLLFELDSFMTAEPLFEPAMARPNPATKHPTIH